MDGDGARPPVALVDDVSGRASVELLGPFRVLGPQGADHLGGGLAAALVALLGLRLGQPVDRDDLIAALWSADPRDDAGPALRQLVARGRRVLPEGAIDRVDVGGRSAYRMSPELVAVDLIEFERLVDEVRRAASGDRRTIDAALELVRGAPLSGLPDLEVFDDARRAAETSIAELRRARLIADAEDCHTSLLSALDDALSDAPDDEAIWTAKVRYLARTGRPAAAARAAADARRVLLDVGIEPSPALRRAEQLALDLGTMTPLAPTPLPPLPDLVGRVRERADAVTALLDGRIRLVNVWGAPGMGTSSLLAAVANDLEATGATVAFVEVSAPVPGPTDGRLLTEEIASQLGWTSQDGDPRRWMSVVVPAGAVLALDAGVCHDDLVVTVRAITCGWPGPVVLAASRPTGLPGEHAVRLSALAHDDAVEQLRRRTELLRGRPVPDAECGALAEVGARAGGIPLVIELVARQLATCSTSDLLAGPMSSGLADRVEAIVGRLDATELAALHRVVWIGGPFDLVDAVRMFPRPRPGIEAVRRALATLVEVGLVQFEDDRPTSAYRVLAPIASTLRAGEAAMAVRRSAVHRRTVTLASRGRRWASQLGRSDEGFARAMLLARLPELCSAARDASNEAPIQRSLLRASVEVMVTVGRASEAQRLLDRVVRNDTDFARYVHDLVIATYSADDHQGVVELVERARGIELPTCDRMTIATAAVRSLRTLGRFAEAHTLLDELTALVQPHQPLDIASLRMERGMVLVYEDRRDSASALLGEARIDFQQLHVTRAVGACDIHLAWCASTNGAHDRAEELLRRAWGVAIGLGHAADDAFCRATAARFAVQRGRYEQALEHCRIVESYARPAPDQLLLARVLEARSAAERGLGRSSEDAAFEAALIRRRLQAPLSPFERRWEHSERILTVAGV